MEIIIEHDEIGNDNLTFEQETILGKKKKPIDAEEIVVLGNDPDNHSHSSNNEVVTKRSKRNHVPRQLDRQTVYNMCLISKRVVLDLTHIGTRNEDLSTTLYRTLCNSLEGKCTVEGFVKPNSCELVSYSSGVVEAGSFVSFIVDFKCFVCNPPEGANIECVVKNITKAGIRAELNCYPHETSPIVVFIARDHYHHNNDEFNSANVGGIIEVHVIGKRFELNDNYVSIIGSMARKRRL